MTTLTIILLITLGLLVAVAVWQRTRQRRLRPRSTFTDPARLQAAALAAQAATRTDPALDDVCANVRAVTGWDIAFVTVADADRVVAVGRDNMPAGPLTDTPVKDSLCAVVVARQAPLVLRRSDLASALVGGCMAGRKINEYVGVPVRRDGQVVGALAVANRHGFHGGVAPQHAVVALLPYAQRIERQLNAA